MQSRPSLMSVPARDPLPDHPAPAPVPRPAALVAVRPGAIILARHGEPALSRKCLLTSDQYRDWWAKYEVGGLRAGQTPPPELLATAEGAGAIYASTRPRAQETAAAIAAGREVMSDALFIEAPLPPPDFPSWFKVGPRAWGVIARFWWWAFNHHDEGEESRDEAKVRARKAADMLEAKAAEGGDVLVFAHGFFNGMIGMELTRRGWRCAKDQGFQYWCARRFEKS